MNPSAAAMSFECVKVSMSQTKDGLKIVLVVHPNDMSSELFSHPVGARYQVAMVLVDDEGQPVMPKRRTEGERAVSSAGMLAKEPAFQKWLFADNKISDITEDRAAEYIKTYCGISSRTELKDDDDARRRFDTLRLAFSQSRGSFP